MRAGSPSIAWFGAGRARAEAAREGRAGSQPSRRLDFLKRVIFGGFEAVTVEAIRELRAEQAAETAELRRSNDALREALAALGERMELLEGRATER